MGGMRAQLSWVEKWGEELYKAKLHEFNIGVIIAVKDQMMHTMSRVKFR